MDHRLHSTDDARLCRIAPPYERLSAIAPDSARPDALHWGDALIWRPRRGRGLQAETRFVARRTPGTACFVVLPPPSRLAPLMPILARIHTLRPTGILPDTPLGPPLIRTLLRAPPPDLVFAACDHIGARLSLEGESILGEIEGILRASGSVRTVAGLARVLCLSRRTVGRHFASAGLPAPSRWLQFARLFRVAMCLREERVTIARAAHALGYPDGFTMSNQMKRLTGYRPSQLHKILGWEWLIEAWLQSEARIGHIDRERYPQVRSLETT